MQTNPWILKTTVRQRTGLVIGWNSQTLLTCVDHRLREEGQGFSPVVRHLGISKHVHYCKRKCETIFVIFLLRCLKPLLPKFQRLSVVCLVTGDNAHQILSSGMSTKCFFTGVGFVAVDFLILPCITLGPRGFFVLFFWWQSCDQDCTLNNLFAFNVYTDNAGALALMSGFAPHNHSFATKIKKKPLAPMVTLHDS